VRGKHRSYGATNERGVLPRRSFFIIFKVHSLLTNQLSIAENYKMIYLPDRRFGPVNGDFFCSNLKCARQAKAKVQEKL